ncbi:GNAT family N-acetyltransferase [Ancylomarina euxinus]|uniref:GNAT family N-acetyltransferase n=1 Tax=Ancylomarina euxinus TaxID=2283627 RepID=A0A425Y335_9BACT|nr:GNAT family N-acetyltransferase [Ancylomarina euxinus]RRG22198.1 GNAT family N-acetyltransferase [Ancylomarina euxinus]
MITIIRTNSRNQEFKKLVNLLNSDLANRDGENHPLSQFNVIDDIKHVVLAYENNEAIACGAIEEFDLNTMEVKRVYASPEVRGKKIGTHILLELENWVKELGYSRCILFIGMNQPEAKRLYERNAYMQIQKYGKLAKIADCLCFAKCLGSGAKVGS